MTANNHRSRSLPAGNRRPLDRFALQGDMMTSAPIMPLYTAAPRTRSPPQLRPETYPALSCKRKADRRCEDRYKTMPITFEEIREVDEESATTSASTNDSPCRKFSDDGRSPYAIRHDDWLYCNAATHPLISPKFQRRSPAAFPMFGHQSMAANSHRLLRGFSDPIVRRKRSTERLNSFDLAVDLLNLPPIPEASGPISPVSSARLPMRTSTRHHIEEETDEFYDDSSECSDFTNGSSS